MSYKEQAQAKLHLTAMMYGDSRQEALKERKKFERAFRHNPKALKTVVENWERLTTYYDFPREHWKHLRTSNVVQSRFSRVRLRTTASRRFKSQINATSLIWKTLMVAEMSFRKLNAPNLVEKVAEGKRYDSGKEIRVANIWKTDATKQALTSNKKVVYPNKTTADPIRYSDRDRMKAAKNDKEKLEQALKTGEEKAFYRRELGKMGWKVTSVNYDKPDYVEYEIVKGDQSYEVQIDLDKNSHKATKVDVAYNAWQTDATEKALKQTQARK